jgi:hypothetical protein
MTSMIGDDSNDEEVRWKAGACRGSLGTGFETVSILDHSLASNIRSYNSIHPSSKLS